MINIYVNGHSQGHSDRFTELIGEGKREIEVTRKEKRRNQKGREQSSQ